LSWHSGDWANFTVALFSAVAAISAAIAAHKSGKSAQESLEQQRNSFKFEQKKYIQDLLKADAAKANASVHNTKGMDWSFYQAANATLAIDSARQTISSASLTLSDCNTEELKVFFKEQLCFEITSEMNEGFNMPDGFIDSHKSFRESRDVFQLWIANLRFFGLISEEETPFLSFKQ